MTRLPPPFSRKRFGQHFLEPAWIEKVVRAIDPKPDEDFYEIGPGRGALTRPLAARARSLVAFEIDRDLTAELRRAALPNLTIVPGDFLESSWIAEHPSAGPIRVAGNLPYNVAAPILFRLVDLYNAARAPGVGPPFTDATLMLQREVADRLVAKPGTREYGVLPILIGHSAEITRVLALPPGAFRPAPKIHSALVRLRFHAPDPPVPGVADFRALVQAIFTRRRKTLANALLAYAGSSQLPPKAALEAVGLDGRRRPETLTLAEIAQLCYSFAVSRSSRPV
jgi:16S rRNA (adenine1518-N6/adenine1519-N6)-dimethyltransferase